MPKYHHALFSACKCPTQPELWSTAAHLWVYHLKSWTPQKKDNPNRFFWSRIPSTMCVNAAMASLRTPRNTPRPCPTLSALKPIISVFPSVLILHVRALVVLITPVVLKIPSVLTWLLSLLLLLQRRLRRTLPRRLRLVLPLQRVMRLDSWLGIWGVCMGFVCWWAGSLWVLLLWCEQDLWRLTESYGSIEYGALTGAFMQLKWPLASIHCASFRFTFASSVCFWWIVQVQYLH